MKISNLIINLFNPNITLSTTDIENTICSTYGYSKEQVYGAIGYLRSIKALKIISAISTPTRVEHLFRV